MKRQRYTVETRDRSSYDDLIASVLPLRNCRRCCGAGVYRELEDGVREPVGAFLRAVSLENTGSNDDAYESWRNTRGEIVCDYCLGSGYDVDSTTVLMALELVSSVSEFAEEWRGSVERFKRLVAHLAMCEASGRASKDVLSAPSVHALLKAYAKIRVEVVREFAAMSDEDL